MKNFRKKPHNASVLQPIQRNCSNSSGNVLIYVVVVMLIFGVLGVIMVSLFTSSTASTVTRNDTRRAIYMAESGMRYGFSELLRTDFDEDFIINTLNKTIDYKVTNGGSFTINVFSPWFDSKNDMDGVAQIPLLVRLGQIPEGFAVPPGVFLVNYEFVGENPEVTGVAAIGDVESQTLTEITYNLNDPIVASKGERICFAVKPTENRTIPASGVGNLYISREAREIFPRFAGAIRIGRNEYFYDECVDDPDNNRVELTNIVVKTPESSLPLNVTTADYVILSPRNYLVVPTGTSDAVTYGGDYRFGKGIYDSSLIRPGSRKPDFTADEYTSEIPPRGPYITVDTDADTINIGSGRAPVGGAEFDTAFYGGDKSIGGDPDYCQEGACLFNLGVRVFFLLDFDNQGDGVTFTLTSFGPPLAPQNSATSVGGDIQLSELMGYAGDSRLVPDPDPLNDLDFLATNNNDRGLDPPKIAVEFDTRTNNTANDPPPDYCSGADANADSRNDPLADNKDAVQYVFWGRTSFLDILCRNNNTLYDDNRHDADGEEPAEEWRSGMGGPSSAWRPAIGPDGTIYASDQVSTLYAFNEDGTVKWTFNLTDGNDYMPGIDRTGGPNDGTIYSDIFGSSLVAIRPDGSQKWRFLISPSSDIDSTPTVGPGGIIYFGTDEAHALIALNPDGTERWRFPTGGEVDNVAALSPDGTTVYFVSNDNKLYALKPAARLADPTGAGGINIPQGEWTFPILTEPNEIQSSPTVKSDGTIYVGSDDFYVYALKPAARLADPTGVGGVNTAQGEWRFRTNGEIESSAAIDPDDGTIYIGSDDGNLWAIRPNGTEKWRFPTGGNVESSPTVDLDGTIYIGSLGGNLYAINPNGTEKWVFPTGAGVSPSPALGQAGYIHIGSNNGNFYTISQFANPRNFKDENKTEGKLLTFEDLGVDPFDLDDTNDWLNGRSGLKGPWAVRLEVDRSLLPNAAGDFDYQMSLWIRQCQNLDCSDISGTFFSDTRIDYENAAIATLPMIQQFSLSGGLNEDHDKFNRFFFGFTGSTGPGQAQNAIISEFNLSFIRPGDPVVDVAQGDDLGWQP